MAKTAFQIALEKKLAEAGAGGKPKSSGTGRLQRPGGRGGTEFKPSSQSDSMTQPSDLEEGPSTLVKVGVGLLGLGALLFLGSLAIKSRS